VREVGLVDPRTSLLALFLTDGLDSPSGELRKGWFIFNPLPSRQRGADFDARLFSRLFLPPGRNSRPGSRDLSDRPRGIPPRLRGSLCFLFSLEERTIVIVL